MAIIEPKELIFLMVSSFFILGMTTFLAGLFVLVIRAFSRDVRSLTSQTAQLVQKGIAEDVAGLVGNASALLDGLQQMVKTNAGIGVFLTLIGLGMMGLSGWVALQTGILF